jgi:hypothetical protein
MNGLRLIYLAILLAFTGLSVNAITGDDEKNGDKIKDKEKVVKTDTVIDVDVNNAVSDDTLVFEDWENPGGNIKDNTGSAVCVALNPNTFQPKKETEDKPKQIAPESIAISTFEIKVFPNPTTEILNYTSQEEVAEIRIISISGQQQNVKILPQSVDVSHLPQGTYFIQFIFTNRIESRKFIKS